MGTHAFIAKLNKDLSVNAIYVHYDGQISKTGQILYDCYYKESQVDRLIENGSLVTLKENIDNIEFYSDIKGVSKEIYHFNSMIDLEEHLHHYPNIEYVYMYNAAVHNDWLVSEFNEINHMIDWQFLNLELP